MPYKDKEVKLAYDMGYMAGFYRALKLILGDKCCMCQETQGLQIHHKNGLHRKNRRVPEDYKNIEELELRCKAHHGY